MNDHLYRLKQINENECELHEEEIKQGSIIQKYHSIINFCDACLLVVQFRMFLLHVGFLSNFQEIIFFLLPAFKVCGVYCSKFCAWPS